MSYEKASRIAFALVLGLAAIFSGALYLVMKAKDAACVIAAASYCSQEKKP